ncbi:MAG TPA: hypothetical protein VMS56_14380 [Thermoanaerobaculia bacterium]|nr:hypothetical protein [Thermoanaerobaculia bacterium]
MRLVLAVVLGGVIAFAWQAFSWMVLPWHGAFMKPFENEAALTSFLEASAPEGGLYVHPMDENAPPGTPFVYAVIVPEGSTVTGSKLFTALLTQILGAALIAFIVAAVPFGFWYRVMLVVAIGLAAGVLGRMGDAIWWHFPLGYVLVEVADLVIAWFLAGLAIAKWVPAWGRTGS